MERGKCSKCKKEGERVATTAARPVDSGQIYQVPCYFCMSCMHEEEVPLDQIETWAVDYWAKLPKSIRPPERSIRGRATTTDFPDHLP